MQSSQINQGEILLNATIVKQIMRDVYPTSKSIDIVEKNYQTPNTKALAMKILQQDKNIVIKSSENLNRFQEKTDQFVASVFGIRDSIDMLSMSVKEKKEEPLFTGVDAKIAEFSRWTEQNNLKIKKNWENIPEIQRKKKENEEFFKKFIGEKKVWLDRLKEITLRDSAYSNGFKYLYEAKTIKLLLEGIWLEKVQDEVEKVLSEQGESYGWHIMDENKLMEERKIEEFEWNKRWLEMDEHQAESVEALKRREWDEIDQNLGQKREDIVKLWKQLFAEIWLPKTEVSSDPAITAQRELVKRVTMEVTFNSFLRNCFDVWKFKNMINSCEEYIVIDKMRRYFPEKSTSASRDESILDTLMELIEGLKQEEEIIYCNLGPAKERLKEYQKKNTNTDNEAIQRISTIINKIIAIQQDLERTPDKLIRSEVEEIRELIKAIPDWKEQKLFKDNLKNESRLYDTFLPWTNILMVVAFISIGQKRNKGYEEKIEGYTKDNNELKFMNNEIAGKSVVLEDIKEKLKNENGNEIWIGEDVDHNQEYKEQVIAMRQAKEALNGIIEIRNKMEMLKFDYYKKLKNALVLPKKLHDWNQWEQA